MCQRVIRFIPVGLNVLSGQENPNRVSRIQRMLTLTNVAGKQQTRRILHLELEMTIQQPERKP
jgi:hypothetical protein